MPTTYAGVGNPRDFDQVDYGGGTIGKKVDGGWLYDWRKDPYQDVLSDSDVQQQKQLTAFRGSNPGMHVAEDDIGALAQMSGQQGLYANDAQGNNSGAPVAPQNQTPSQQWSAQPTTGLPVTGSVPAPAAGDAAPTPASRSTQLFDMLMQRMQQPITPDRNDPTIRGQADAYSAQQDRASRNYLADQAESMGPYANLQGEQRLAAEHAGQASGAFEAGLIGKEQDARRASIASDLALYGGQLTDQEKLQLQEELGLRDAAAKEQQIGNDYSLGLMGNQTTQRGQSLNYDEMMRELALREWTAGNQDYYTRAGLTGS